MKLIFEWNIAADFLTAIISVILFFALLFLPNNLYKTLLKPYYYIVVLIATWFLESGFRKAVNILYQFHYVSYTFLSCVAWGSAILACVTLGFILPRLNNLGLLNYIALVRKEALSKFDALFSLSVGAIIVSSQESIITEWNKGAEEIFGYTSEEAIGQSLTIIMPERYRGMHLMGMHRYVSTGESKLLGKTIRIEALRKNGTEFPIELSLTSYKMGGQSNFIAVVRDISARQVLEKENAQLKEKVTSGEIRLP